MTDNQGTRPQFQDPRAWRTLSRRELLARPPRLRVLVEKVRLPDGKIIEDFYQIELPEYVVIFAQTTEGSVVMERHYKHGLRRVSLTLPAGYLESGEDPLTAAKRELLEETGYEAENWRYWGRFVVDSNRDCGKAHLFMAGGAYPSQPPNSPDLEETEVLLMTEAEAIQAVLKGEVATLASIATLALALNPQFTQRWV